MADIWKLLDVFLNEPTRWAKEQGFNDWETLGFALAVLLLEFSLIYGGMWLVVFSARNIPSFFAFILRWLGVGRVEQIYSLIQVTFPMDKSRSAYATEQLHLLLAGLVKYPSFWERRAAQKQPYSLEIVATKEEGIRYLLWIPTGDVETIRRTIGSFLPGAKVGTVEGYDACPSGYSVALGELALSADTSLPLKDNKMLAEYDPIAHLSSQMQDLKEGEMVVYQLVVAPVLQMTHRSALRRLEQLRHRIALQKPLTKHLKRRRSAWEVAVWIVLFPAWLVFMACKGILHVLSSILIRDESPSGKLSPYEHELSEVVRHKLDQSLFEVSLRVVAVAKSEGEATSRVGSLVAAFTTFTSPYQSLQVIRPLPFSVLKRRVYDRFLERRLTSFIVNQPALLTSAELSDLYHFPHSASGGVGGVVKSRSRDLPAPLALQASEAGLDVVVGQSTFGNKETPLGMTLSQRQKHTYVIGKTGTGKTTLLKHMIYQDMVNGKGVAVFDPHGDLFRELLALVPDDRRKDVVVFDPSDRAYPVGLNILQPGVEFEDKDDTQEWITSTVISVFAKLADPAFWGPRMEHILRNVTLTALQQPSPSLYTLQRLLTDTSYQKKVARDLEDPILKQFWTKEFSMMGNMQMAAATAPLTHRLGHFITAKMSRHILLQEKTTVNMQEVMDEGKILLVNLSKGDIGEDRSSFFGVMLTSLIWMAAYRRTKQPEEERRDFFVYIDEFQNFATPRFSEIASEGRKFRIGMTVSHQNIAQIEDRSIVKIVAGNAATMIALRVSPEDEDFLLPFMKPEVEKGDIVNLAPYRFYMKSAGERSDEAFSGMTLPFDFKGDVEAAGVVKELSRQAYAVPKSEAERLVARLLQADGQVEVLKKPVRTRKRRTRPKEEAI